MKVSKKLKRSLIVFFSTLYGAGMTYWLSRLFLRQAGQFGDEPHFLEKLAGPLHLAAAFLFVFLVGVFWARHIEGSVRLNRNRWSGWIFLSMLALLLSSGLVILYGSEDWIHKSEQIHPWFGASLLPLLSFHWLARALARRRGRN